MKLDKDEKSKNVDVQVYKSMNGSLLYLMPSRPNIMFSVYLHVRFQTSFKESHLHAVKGLLDMLKVHLVLTCFILSIHHLIKLVIVMQIMPGAK